MTSPSGGRPSIGRSTEGDQVEREAHLPKVHGQAEGRDRARGAAGRSPGPPGAQGGDCPPTAVSLVDSTTTELDPSADMDGCTIVLEERLAAQSSGEVCQEIFSLISSQTFACAQLTPAQCSDSADNDRDGRTDFPADPGCASATDNDETDPPPARQCSDGRDNDRDGRIDYPRDPGCSSARDDNESNPRPANPCTITGTRGNDVIRGTSGRDVICAGAGNDIVYGRGAQTT